MAIRDNLNNNLNMRYDEENDMILIYCDGEWKEWQLAGFKPILSLIPILTADNGRIVSNLSSSIYTGALFNFFNGIYTLECTFNSYTPTKDSYIGYDFGKTVSLSYVKIRMDGQSAYAQYNWNCKLQYSDDGINWKDCSKEYTLNGYTPIEYELKCNSLTKCEYFRVLFTGGTDYLHLGGNYQMPLAEISAYGREES